VGSSLIDRVRADRRRAFVGRERELARFADALDAREGSIWYVHGPGGIGKTSLLHQVAWLGEQRGRRVAWRDGRDCPIGTSPLDGDLASADLVLVDHTDALGPPDHWLTERVLATLPYAAVVVLAGPHPPPLSWRVDPGWHELVRTVRLDHLSAAESAELLASRGVPADEHERATALTHGHPLALALVADAAAQGSRTSTAGPQTLAALLDRLLGSVPAPQHREALEATAQVRVTTEPLLCAMLGTGDARDLFDWLRGLSFVDTETHGLYLHELVRDALAAELRWRHPARHGELRARARAYYWQAFDAAPAGDRQQILLDFAYLHRESPVLGPLLAGLAPGAGDLWIRPARPDEHAAIVSTVEHWEGTEAGRLAAYWLRQQPATGFAVADTTGAMVGCFVLLQVSDDAADPGVAAVHAYVRKAVPLRTDEVATMIRFWCCVEEYQAVSAVQTLITLYLVQHILTTPGLAMTFVAYAEPDVWADANAYADMDRLPEADFEVGGRTYGVFGHDWRIVPPMAWLRLLAARETAARPLDLPRPAGAAPLRVLDEDGFAEAVRRTLADLGRADRLAGSPLLDARFVARRLAAGAGTADRVAALQAAVREAAGQLQAAPKGLRGYRAVHHTYLQPAETQQAAADLLRLPMSTFRRHLTEGVRELTALLWQQELGAD
jgi:hypothetical protein